MSGGISSADVELGAKQGMKHAASFAALDIDTQGIRITVENLSYRVPSFKDKKTEAELLSNVSGVFNPGEMVALLGPSGSGKTTFLDVLAGRKAVGTTSGVVKFGGITPTSQFLRRYTGYVEQFDTLIAALTAREMLLYTAELKRPMQESLQSKETAVDALLVDLGLWEARDVLVGSPMVKGLSGGQSKRLNIAIALITDPSVLFLVEPTSGLDSFTANEVMSVVKKLCTSDTTIVATIHSPTAYAFSLFDAASILCSGKQVYFGPSDATLISYAQTALQTALPGGVEAGVPAGAQHSASVHPGHTFAKAPTRLGSKALPSAPASACPPLPIVSLGTGTLLGCRCVVHCRRLLPLAALAS